MLNSLARILATCGTGQAVMPPTELYNEGWMLRLVLDHVSRQADGTSPLAFAPGARWYSEALLHSRFLRTSRADKRGEGYTHADGVIGHFHVDSGTRGEAILCADARQFVVIEAKMGSPLAAGTNNAADYDQAARNVACMAHMVHRAGIDPGQLNDLAFFVIAPACRIDIKGFDSLLTRDSIEKKVRRRVAVYDGGQDDFMDIFLSIFPRIRLAVLSWESILDSLPVSEETDALRHFYQQCMRFNLPRSSRARQVLPPAPEACPDQGSLRGRRS